DPDGEQTGAQWESKRHLLDRAAGVADAQVAGALLRIGLSAATGAGRVVFNASSWTRSDVLRVPDGAGRRLGLDGRDWPAVDLPDGSALVVAGEVPPLGYVALTEPELGSPRRDRLPGIGVRLLVERRRQGCTRVATVVTLYDELPWLDIENRITKPATLEKEALYVAFPFALTKPTVDVEVPLGRMTVERDQQAGSGRDWYSHAHWVWLRDAADGMLWSGPDTPLVTLHDIFRGQGRRRPGPDGTLFAYVLHNYWPTNFAARQGGDFVCRFRVSALAPGSDRAEPVRRGWAGCEPPFVRHRHNSAG